MVEGPINLSFLHSAFVDKEYLVMGSHVDEALVKCILNNEYIDFARLLPKDKLHVEEDGLQRMELVNKNGMTYWSLVSTHEAMLISSFSKWETAFRVFANIYTKQ